MLARVARKSRASSRSHLAAGETIFPQTPPVGLVAVGTRTAADGGPEAFFEIFGRQGDPTATFGKGRALDRYFAPPSDGTVPPASAYLSRARRTGSCAAEF